MRAPQRRSQLLEVALERFAARGFHRTSMDDIAEAAGVTKPVLYQHFTSKRSLYLELLDDVGAQLLITITDATSRAEAPRAQVEAGFAAYFRFVAEHRSAFRLMFGIGPGRDEEFAEAVARVEDAITDEIAKLIEAELAPDHRHQLARAIVGLAEGVSRDVVMSAQEIDPDVLSRRLAELTWAGLRGIHPD